MPRGGQRIDCHRDRRAPGQAQQPLHFGRPDDVVGQENIGDIAGHHHFGLAHLLATNANRPSFDLHGGNFGNFV